MRCHGRRSASSVHRTDQMSTCIVPATFEAAFKTHLQSSCPELGAPDDPLVDAPSQPRDIALADIEREIALAAISAHPDSVDRLVRDFVSVRSFRRAGLSGGFVKRERAREYRDGMAAYVRFRARELAEGYIDPVDRSLLTPSVKDTFCLKSWLCKPTGLDWYRTSASPAWGPRSATFSTGRGPSGAIRSSTAASIRMRSCGLSTWVEDLTSSRSSTDYGFTAREDEATSFINATKSGPEKLFDDDHTGERPLFLINTEQLASTTVSYDREHIAKVDCAPRGPQADHQDRVLRRHAHLCDGTPDGGRARRRRVRLPSAHAEAPDAYEIKVGGIPFTPSARNQPSHGPLSVTANGLEIEAQDAIIVSAEGRLSFVLHR